MKKSLFFVAIFGLTAFVGQAIALDPSFQPGTVTTPPAYSSAAGTKDATIRVATTSYVDTKVGDATSGVTGLDTSATSAQGTVTTNGTAITSLSSNKIDKPTGTANACPSTCGANGTTQCECGFIKAAGANGAKQWVVIY